MIMPPHGKYGEIYKLGSEHLAMWALLNFNAGRQDTNSITTSCGDLGKEMPGQVIDRCRVLRILQKLEWIGVISFKTTPKTITVTVNEIEGV